MAAPTSEINFRVAFCAFLLFYFYKCLSAEADIFDDSLLCRQCGHDIAHAADLVQTPSSLSIRQRNDTIMGVKGVLIQLFKNPEGRHFEVITASTADVLKFDQAVSGHSWFPGFSWRISLCPKCGQHLGWSFEPHNHKHGKSDSDKTFIGLILENLLHPDYADSLLITPKSYIS